MATKNDITGDRIVSRSPSYIFRENWDRIFGTKSTSHIVDSTKTHVGTNDGEESADNSNEDGIEVSN